MKKPNPDNETTPQSNVNTTSTESSNDSSLNSPRHWNMQTRMDRQKQRGIDALGVELARTTGAEVLELGTLHVFSHGLTGWTKIPTRFLTIVKTYILLTLMRRRFMMRSF